MHLLKKVVRQFRVQRESDCRQQQHESYGTHHGQWNHRRHRDGGAQRRNVVGCQSEPQMGNEQSS